jgi:2-polyprenyl-3-methyl-5-hydroxy-6-metoxy-1,4-benzoquinol methylase
VQKVLTPQQYLQLSPKYDSGAYLDSASREQLERFLNIPGAVRVLERVIQRYLRSAPGVKSKRSFLDVGCGMGRYLLAAQKLGFDVTGFEPSAEHAHVATSLLKLPVLRDCFKKGLVGDQTFDLIMLSHVIEHIYAPKDFLHELISVLKPGGVLIVITPNSDSLVARMIGRSWPMLKQVDHVTILCARAYSHFELEALADMHHRYSELPYEFAATLAAAVKAKLFNQGHEPTSGPSSSPPLLRRLGLKTELLRKLLTAASAPAWLTAVATKKRACLSSAIVRKTSTTT